MVQPMWMRTLCGIATVGALAHADGANAGVEHFDSVLHAISDANGQAHLSLAKGRYRATSGGTRLTLDIPANMSSKLKYDVRRRSIRAADWAFDQPLLVTIESGGRCVRLSVKRLRYDEGGVPMSQGSDTTMTPLPGPNACNDSEAMLGLADVLSLSQDPGAFFRGAVLSNSESLRRCTDAACTSTTQELPIRKARFFGSTGPDGRDLPAFAVTLREGSTLVLPSQSFIKVGAGSGAQFDNLEYDLVAKAGQGLLSKVRIAVDEGVIASGSTILRLTALSDVSADSMAVSTSPDGFSLDRGSISGRLGEGSNIVLAAHQGRISSVSLLGADATLAGLNLTTTNNETKLKVTRGSFRAKLKSGEFWLTEMSSLRVDYTNLDFVIGCPDGAPPGCAGVEWSGRDARVKGTIQEFATNISGGQFPFSEAGMTQIKSGKIESGVLILDSTNPISPIVGPFKVISLAFEGQDLHIDGRTKIAAARVSLDSRDLAFVSGERLPVGTLDIAGDITRFEAGEMGAVTTIDGTVKMQIARQAGDAPILKKGEIDAKSRIRLEGANYADGTLKIRDMYYYRGFGTAKAQLSIDEAQYEVVTPRDRKSEDNSLARVEINIRPATIRVSLKQAFVVGPFEVKAAHSSWKIDPAVRNQPFVLAAAIPRHELVYAPIKEKLTGSTLCAPKVHLTGQTSTIGGKVNLEASSEGGKISVHSLTSDGPIDADVDDNGCSEVGALICGAVGSLGGPIGAIALAAICNKKIEDAEAELEGQIRTMSGEAVGKFRYDFSW